MVESCNETVETPDKITGIILNPQLLMEMSQDNIDNNKCSSSAMIY